MQFEHILMSFYLIFGHMSIVCLIDPPLEFEKHHQLKALKKDDLLQANKFFLKTTLLQANY